MLSKPCQNWFSSKPLSF